MPGASSSTRSASGASSRRRSTSTSTGTSGCSATTRWAIIDVKQDLEELTELVEIGEDDVFILHPGEFVLGSTAERVALPDDLVARLEGKSSLGRLGLLIHSTAGLRRRRLGRPPHARAVERGDPARSRSTRA